MTFNTKDGKTGSTLSVMGWAIKSDVAGFKGILTGGSDVTAYKCAGGLDSSKRSNDITILGISECGSFWI